MSWERSRLLLDGQDGNAFIRFVKLVGGAVKLGYLQPAGGQIKIRGIRIEANEVERYLTAHLSVKAAAVAAISSGDGESFLVGFLSVRDGSVRFWQKWRKESRSTLRRT